MNNGLKIVCAALMVAWGSCSVSPGAEAPRLAVLSTSSEVAGMADLLSVELSAKGGVVLVEREQIQKLWREQELSGSQRQGFIKLGRLLNADGLLLAERGIEGTNALLSVRLIAIKPGVILTEHRFVLPLADLAEWSKSYASQIERLLPKLAVKAEEAVPVSILNLRSSVNTSEGLALEQELTTLLRFRLAHEPAIFVLERQRMEELQAEKDLTPTDPEPFWNGAYVLDGIINRDVVSRETVTIDGRLAPPHNAPVNLAVSGKREALRSVVDELAQKVLMELGKVRGPTAWDPRAEAERFAQEASWDERWALWRQMAEAADASWALGLQISPVAAHRVWSRGKRAYTLLGPLRTEPVGPYGFRPPPSPEALALLTQALEIYRDCFPMFAAETNGSGRAWSTAGIGLLNTIAPVLGRFNERVEFMAGNEDDLRRLREVARGVVGILTTNRDVVVGLPSKDLPDLLILQTTLRCGGRWFDKPADAIELYRGLLDPRIYPSGRRALLAAGRPLIAWSVKERQELPSMWLGFLREMASSTNDQMRVDGLRLILEHSEDPTELETAARRFTDEAWSARLELFRQQGFDAPVEHVLNSLAHRVELWGIQLAEKAQTLEQNWLERFREARPDMSYEIWKELVSKFTNAAVRSVGLTRPPIPPRPEQVRELLAEMEAIQREHRSRFDLKHWIEDLKSSAGSSNQTASSILPHASAITVSAQNKTSGLAISKYWSVESLEIPPNRSLGFVPRLRHMVWHQNRLWFETKIYPNRVSATTARPGLVAWDPKTPRAELLEVPIEDLTPPWDSSRSTLMDSEPFVYTEGALWHRDERREWHRSPVPVSGLATPYAWGKRIVLSANQSIVAFEPQTEQVRLLASTRRNPPVSALDRVLGPAPPPLAIWPEERLCALVGGTVWIYDTNKQDWFSTFTATNCGERVELHPSGLFYRQSGECGPRLLGGLRPGSSLLEFHTWESTRTLAQPKQNFGYTPPIWVQPEGARAHESQAAFDGPNLWIFPMPIGEATFQGTPALIDASGRLARAATNNIPTNLLFFDRRFVRGLELRLELTGAARAIASEFDAVVGKGWGFGAEFLPTPDGLAILVCEGGHLLWIPKTDLESALAEAEHGNPQSQRLEFTAFQRFDRGHKGWLTDAERRTMRHDAVWLKEEKAGLETATKAALARHGAEWGALFVKADKNGDGKLSSFELAAAVTAYPQVFAEHLRGLNGPLLQAMQPYDLDNDLALDRTEFFNLLADPRLIAEVNRSADWVTKFGLKPELCDTNDDGVLDSGERLMVNRLIRERLATAGKGK